MQGYKKSVLKPIQPKKQIDPVKATSTTKCNKFEGNVIIKPSSGYDKQIDYRFET